MSLILRIESGPHAGKALPIEAGGAIRVGRAAQAGYVIAEDSFLSSIHFEVRWDGQTCTLLDLNSSNGTRIGGARITQAPLMPGERFTAGQTDFSIVGQSVAAPAAASGSAPPAACSGPVEPLDWESREQLLKEMRSNLQPLYAVLDAAHDSKILAVLSKYKCEFACLFHAEQAPELMRFAPYIVALPPTSAALEPLVDLGWGKDWGIYLTSTASGGDLIQFLRRLLISIQPDGQQVLLRFYDPRVLRTLLGNAAPAQWSQWFGPVRSYLMADENTQTAIGFAVSERGLERHDIPLGGRKAAEREVVMAPLVAGSTPEHRLLLSKQQMTALRVRERDVFAQELFEEMQEKHPDRFARLGEMEMREWIKNGCTQPKRYGIQTEAGIRDYVSLMMQLGRNFDEDPELPWASDLLKRRLPALEKLKRLKNAASEFATTQTIQER
jgi:hypothetical protein